VIRHAPVIIKIISVRAAWASPSLALPLEIGAIAPLAFGCPAAFGRFHPRYRPQIFNVLISACEL
jgi:hypothetical protein